MLPLLPGFQIEYGINSRVRALTLNGAPAVLPLNFLAERTIFGIPCGRYTRFNHMYDIRIEGEGGEGAHAQLLTDGEGVGVGFVNVDRGRGYPRDDTTTEVIAPQDEVLVACRVSAVFKEAKEADVCDQGAGEAADADSGGDTPPTVAADAGQPLFALKMVSDPGPSTKYHAKMLVDNGRQFTITPSLPHCPSPPCRTRLVPHVTIGEESYTQEQRLKHLTDVPHLLLDAGAPEGERRVCYWAGLPKVERGMKVTGMEISGDMPYRAAILSRGEAVYKNNPCPTCNAAKVHIDKCQPSGCFVEDALSRRLGSVAAGVSKWRSSCAATFQLHADFDSARHLAEEAFDAAEAVVFARDPALRAQHTFRGSPGKAVPPSAELHAPALVKVRLATEVVSSLNPSEADGKSEKKRLLTHLEGLRTLLEPRKVVPRTTAVATVVEPTATEPPAEAVLHAVDV